MRGERKSEDQNLEFLPCVFSRETLEMTRYILEELNFTKITTNYIYASKYAHKYLHDIRFNKELNLPAYIFSESLKTR